MAKASKKSSIRKPVKTAKRKPARKASAVQLYGLEFDKNVSIPMNDGLVLKANVFRPSATGKFPVIVAMSPYGKDVHFKDAYKLQWDEADPSLSRCRQKRLDRALPQMGNR